MAMKTSNSSSSRSLFRRGPGSPSRGPALTLAVTALASAGLMACDDENDPKTWVKRLDDPAQRAGAIKRLTQFFEDDMTKANKNRDDPGVKALLDDIVDPMTKQDGAGNLDGKPPKNLQK